MDAEILEIVETGPDSWRVLFEDADVELEYDQELSRLYMSSEAGVVTATDRSAIYETMLGYNMLWRDTGGVRLALTPTRVAFIVADLGAAELSAQVLAATLPNLITKARLWRAFIGTAGRSSAPADDLAMVGIRV